MGVRKDIKLNAEKTVELVSSFAVPPANFPPIVIDGRSIAQVKAAKSLGLTICVDLKWDPYVHSMLSKANQRVFALCQLKRSDVELPERVNIFKSTICPIVEYACQAWHSSLTQKQREDIERVQKCALRIAFGPLDNGILLQLSGLPRLSQRRSDLCQKLYLAMKDPSHKLHHRILQRRTVTYKLRNLRTLPMPKTCTKRFAKSFTPWCIAKFN